MRIDIGTTAYQQTPQGEVEVACVPDAVSFSESKSPVTRFMILASAVALGVAGGSMVNASPVASGDALLGMFVLLALVGGFLSTWSPCGYSSLSLLRPAGNYSIGAAARWAPTFVAHAVGYALGALMLGSGLGLIGWLLFSSVPFSYAAMGLAVLAVGYGAHQLGF